VHKKITRDASKNGSQPIWAVFPQKKCTLNKSLF